MRVHEDETTFEDPAPPDSAADRDWWSALRPLVLRLHFYGGVLVAPFLLVAATTGLLYVFTPQLEEAFYPRQLHVPAGDRPLPLSDQVGAALEADPGGTLSLVRPAPGPTDTTRVIFESPDLPESYYRTVFINPYTAEVRGVLETYGSSQALPVRTWIDQLHRNLLLGDPGRLYTELAASWLWVLVLGGLVLWIRRRRPTRGLRFLLTPRTRARGRQRVLSWHGAIGIWVALGLLFLSATGLTWSTFAGANVTEIRAALNAATPAVSTEPVGHSMRDVGIDRVLAVARQHDLNGPVEISPPSGHGGIYSVMQTQRQWPTQQDEIGVRASTGEVTEVVRFEDYPLLAKLARWGIDAHMGMLFGLVNQVILAALVLGLITMIVCGYRMWWLRAPTRGALLAVGAPPRRGAWRVVPGRVLATLILLGVFIAYLIPLLGVSVLVFLAIDVVLGRIARRRAATEKEAR